MEIKLTQGKVAQIDDADAHLAEHKWFFAKSSSRSGYAAKSVYFGNGKAKTTFLHNAILGFPLNRLEVDHINGDKLDNRRCNLRIVTKRVNQLNSILRKTHSKYPGVHFDNRGYPSCWYSKIRVDGKQLALGYFKTQEEAAEAYERAFAEQEKRHAA